MKQKYGKLGNESWKNILRSTPYFFLNSLYLLSSPTPFTHTPDPLYFNFTQVEVSPSGKEAWFWFVLFFDNMKILLQPCKVSKE